MVSHHRSVRDRADGPPFGHRGVPQRTSPRPWLVSAPSGRLDDVIHHADTALEQWLRARADLDVAFVDAPSGATGKQAPFVEVVLVSIAERAERRDTDVADLRDDDGRVTGRQRSLRWFDVTYRLVATGAPRAAHEVLGRLLQCAVDVDAIDPDHLPRELAELGVPIEIALEGGAANGSGGGAALTVRLVVPVQPSADSDIAAPAEILHLDVSPPPGRVARAVHRPRQREEILGERVWTTVRRREEITPPALDAAEGS